MPQPFLLLDDARPDHAADARLYREPAHIVVARRIEEVAPALERIEALRREGHEMAGYLAYEAGLALEPRLAPLAGAHGGGDPLVWFGAFGKYETIPSGEVPRWLAANAAGGSAAIGPLDPALSPGDYAGSFDALRAAILAGDIYQANLTFPLKGPWSGDPMMLYRALRPAALAGYGGVVFDGARWLLSFSPELFFALKDRSVTVRPMKGTRPRGRDAAEDARLCADLVHSTKDRAENLMIVDLMRNDLSRVARAGTVKVENAFTVETYPTVHQMVSTVRAELGEGKGAIDLIRALFPCGSITGAPKIRAMELIAQGETAPRGPYCGAIGRIDASGDAAFNVAIRTLALSSTKGGAEGKLEGHAVLGVGSAIVADSQALPEWRECLVKGGFVQASSVQLSSDVAPAR
ncbi:MAG TPA: aminodeoxychorismate synthase component I, partial [Novosphingobium sp.]|nr:aminodeoxychorismate synthase component I [Novosphingobium sp.]